MKKIGILLYSIFAVLALKRVIRNIGTFRKNYIARRTGNQHVVNYAPPKGGELVRLPLLPQGD